MPVSPDSRNQTAEFDTRLLEQLACPVCFGVLGLLPSGDKVGCAGCGRAYPLIDGIPVLIPEQAISQKPK